MRDNTLTAEYFGVMDLCHAVDIALTDPSNVTYKAYLQPCQILIKWSDIKCGMITFNNFGEDQGTEWNTRSKKWLPYLWSQLAISCHTITSAFLFLTKQQSLSRTNLTHIYPTTLWLQQLYINHVLIIKDGCFFYFRPNIYLYISFSLVTTF